MAKHVMDKKNMLSVWFWKVVNCLVCKVHFRKFVIAGRRNIPRRGPYLLIANHQSRWDALVLMELINGREANYMTHPDELKGLQGTVLRSVGAFPATRSFQLMDFVSEQIRKGEPIVMFPEGGIFTDGILHPFKTGAARILLHAFKNGTKLPVIPVAINYIGLDGVEVVVSKQLVLPAGLSEINDQGESAVNCEMFESNQLIAEWTEELHRSLRTANHFWHSDRMVEKSERKAG